MMKQIFDLATITSGQQQPLALFAVTSLGIVDSLAAGSLTPTQAIHAFFHGKNIQYAKKKLNDQRANEIMGRGVQLADLFDAMPWKKRIGNSSTSCRPSRHSATKCWRGNGR